MIKISFINSVENAKENEGFRFIYNTVYLLLLSVILGLVVHFILWQPLGGIFIRYSFIVFILVLIVGRINYELNEESKNKP